MAYTESFFSPPSLIESLRFQFPDEGLRADYARLNDLASEPVPNWEAISNLADKTIQLTHHALRSDEANSSWFGFISRGHFLKGAGLANMGRTSEATENFIYAHHTAVQSGHGSLFPEDLLIKGLHCLVAMPHITGYYELLSRLERDYSDPLLPAEDTTRVTIALAFAFSGSSETAINVLNAIADPADPQAQHERVLDHLYVYLRDLSNEKPDHVAIPLVCSLIDRWGAQPIGILEGDLD